MPCIDSSRPGPLRPSAWAALALVLGLGGCAGPGHRLPAPSATPSAAVPAKPAAPTVAPDAARPQAPGPAPRAARSWDEFKVQAARRLVAANPQGTYLGEPPEPLLAIPVLEIELHADGSVRRIEVLRQPGQARDTVQLAIRAVQRAAPFGDVSRLPRPWKFTEVFLFDDERRFKPRTLDQ